tara:strand:- start:309 stop:755 length:447 start_codon:yes stop_codon:yes gene_type:complete
MGGLFKCSTSFIGKFYGNISCVGSMIVMIFIYLISIPKKNNGKFILSEFLIIIPIIITIISILITIYDTKKYKKDILKNNANANYYLYNGLYVLSLGVIISLQIFNLVISHYYNFSNYSLNNILKYGSIFMSIINGLFSYLSHYYINK